MLQLFPDSNETIVGVSQRLRDGELRCVDVLNDCLTRIDEHEPAVRAWVSVDREGALARANELDRELAAGWCRGPLHGIPIGIKDIIDVAGTPTAAGSELRSQSVVEEDAFLVARLREAGAIILGKTVTTQFACFDPPATRNPWNLERTPGGSSSGSAAAVATGMCLGAIGSQTGGSITRPASFCGIAGCKPTFMRVSVQGVHPVASSLDHPGPLARCVADLAILLDVIAGYNPADSLSAHMDELQLSQSLEPERGHVPHLGRLRGMFEVRADDQKLRAFGDAVAALSAGGADVVEAPLPDSFEDVLLCHRTIMLAELAALHERRFADHRDDYQPGMQSLIEEGLGVAATEYVRARQHQERCERELSESFGEVDVLICPAALGPAPDPSTTGDPAFNAPWSYSGLPTISFPIGLSREGLPLAIQLVGRPFDEPGLFNAALWCEQVIRESLS